MKIAKGLTYNWDKASTYVQNPPYFEGMTKEPGTRSATSCGARPLAILGDCITTDHISPAGSIKKDGPAGKYLIEHGRAARSTSTPTARGAAITR